MSITNSNTNNNSNDYKQQLKQRLKECSESIEKNPNNPDFYVERYKIRKEFYSIPGSKPMPLELEEKNKADLQSAITLFNVRLRENISDGEKATIYYTRAHIYLLKDEYNRAIVDASRSIDFDSNNPRYYEFRAQLYDSYVYDDSYGDLSINYEMNFLNKNKKKLLALEDYTNAIELDPNNSHYYYFRHKIYIYTANANNDNTDLALNDINEALRIASFNIDYYYARALLYFEKKYDSSKALDDILVAIKLLLKLDKAEQDTYDIHSYFYLLAGCSYNLGRYEDALIAINKVFSIISNKNLDLKKTLYKYHFSIAIIYFMLDKNQEALVEINTVIRELSTKNKSMSIKYLPLRALIYVHLKKYLLADEDISKCKMTSENLYIRGFIHFMMGRKNEAKVDYEKYVSELRDSIFVQMDLDYIKVYYDKMIKYKFDWNF